MFENFKLNRRKKSLIRERKADCKRANRHIEDCILCGDEPNAAIWRIIRKEKQRDLEYLSGRLVQIRK